MKRDPFSIEEIEWTLWSTLACECVRCKTVLPLEEYEPLMVSPMEWARAAAPHVKEQGCSSLGEWELVCEQCAPNNNGEAACLT